MLQHIDASQLLEQYGGSLKLPQRIWPPVDTYSPEERSSLQPFLAAETDSNKHLYTPGTNDAKKSVFSQVPNTMFTAADFETRGLVNFEQEPVVPSEPSILPIPVYKVGEDICPETLYGNIKPSIPDAVDGSARGIIDDKLISLDLSANPSLVVTLSMKPTACDSSFGLVMSPNLQESSANPIEPVEIGAPKAQFKPEAPAVKKCTCLLI